MLAFRPLVPALLWVTSAATVAAAGCGYSAQRTACIDHCQMEHDQCILHAHSAEMIERCDRETDACSSDCQQY
ncbi:MAG TPA: hypothetical protein VHM19_21740 [Polyangiales bacterium]|jgi:hypothetical protein|nr:hypothetical protein [Polyangiales bacterium]